MPISNMSIIEAIESTGVKPTQIVADIKKQMQTCRLTKFASKDACGKLYSSFFLSTLDDSQDPNVEEWGIIYNMLLCDQTFIDNMCYYVTMYQPAQYNTMFKPLYRKIESELKTCGKRKITYLGMARALLSMIQMKFNGVKSVVLPQVNSPETVKFLTVIDQTLQSMQFSLQDNIRTEIDNSADPNDVSPGPVDINTDTNMQYLEEDVCEFLYLLEHADQWIADYAKREYLNEGIVSNAAEAAKAAKVKARKSEQAFGEFVMKKFHEMQTNRRNRKHSEMVGESLRIMHEIKRIIRSGAIYAILGPAAGVITWVTTLLIDKHTDAKDRAVLVADLKDQLEIVEEKISVAERNGDDKGKIELIRFRQKLAREYERINKVAFDKARLAQNVRG